MSVSLFEFSFEEVTAADLAQPLQQLQHYFKQMGNPPRLSKDKSIRVNAYGQIENERIPPSIIPMLPHLQEAGYIHYDGEFVSLREKYRDYHDIGEIDQWFTDDCYKALENGACFYDLLSLRTTFSLHYNISPDAPITLSEVFSQRLDLIALELGLDHFLENPKAAGFKMDVFKKLDRATKNRVVRDLLMLTTPKQVECYFELHALCKGIREYNKDAPWINHETISMLDLAILKPTFFEAVCLAESQEEQTIHQILNYAGAMYSSQLDPEYVLYQGEKRRYDIKQDLKKTFEELNPVE
ncbi:hypothetical protein [Salibacterium aidingense]|uniref:hypothetical protein n=1 Tax=Salibacterium aidingense TaxID=384933 RepID=UPI0003FBDB2A|nr:hypothetical protein [Salibacterium aidingense]